MNRNCERCGNAFQLRKPSSPIRFCSRLCSAQARDKSTIRGTFSPGTSPWNKGRTAWRRNYRHSTETRQKISRAVSGVNGPNWKGGISPENERQRKTAAYQAWRAAVFERDGFCCQTCGDRAAVGHRVTLHADHIKPFATHPDLRLDVANGRTLCAPCHRKTPTYGAGKTAVREVVDG